MSVLCSDKKNQRWIFAINNCAGAECVESSMNIVYNMANLYGESRVDYEPRKAI